MSAPRPAATLARCTLAVVALGATALAPAALHAQARGGAVVSRAEVLPPAVTGTGSQPLRFGTAAPGDVVDVPPAPAVTGAPTSSAGWNFGNVRKGRWVSLSLALPETMTHGAYAIPIDWNNAEYGRICVAGSSGACALERSFNPGALPAVVVQLANNLPGNNFDVRLFVGARVAIPYGIPPGLYTTTVTATFAYVS